MNDLYNALPVFAQNIACSASGLYRAYKRYSPRFHQSVDSLQRTADASLGELHALQWRRLSKLVNRASTHVPYYHDLGAPVESSDPAAAIQETLAGIPILEKAAYRDNAVGFIALDISKRSILRGKTSGTTGTALPIFYSANTLAEEYATVWRLRNSLGVNLRDAHLTFGGQLIVPISQSKPPYWRNNAYQRQILFSIFHMTKLNREAYVEGIHSHDAVYVDGYPSALYIAAQSMLEFGRPLPANRLRAVFTSSESLLAFQRDVIEEAFGAPVRDRYGTAEFAVSMTECVERNLHVDMEYCVVEVEVREETDEYVRGPLIVTGLANEVTPFLRYRIGDSGTRLKSACPCGRPGDVFLDIDGRNDDYVVTPNGREIGRLDHIFKGQSSVVEAQIRQDTVDAIEVLLVPDASFDEECEEKLRREIRSRLGDEIAIRLTRVESIPREANGKFRAVRSRISRSRDHRGN